MCVCVCVCLSVTMLAATVFVQSTKVRHNRFPYADIFEFGSQIFAKKVLLERCGIILLTMESLDNLCLTEDVPAVLYNTKVQSS